jgi:hypothetical protein
MKQVNEERMRLRIEYSRETNLIFSDNIPAYADWLEKRLAAVNETQQTDASVLSKLDEMIEQAQESEKIFEQHNMVSSELTSGAMAQAYKNVKQWILNDR